MNNSDFPSANEDLQDFLVHPNLWVGTDVVLRREDKLSVLHYNALLERYYWYPLTRGQRDARLGRDELCTRLVSEGWRLDDAKP